jgi:hypothetical protein
MIRTGSWGKSSHNGHQSTAQDQVERGWEQGVQAETGRDQGLG